VPIHVPPITRRSFLGGVIAALAANQTAFGQDSAEDRWVLLSDSHIPSDPKTKRGDVAMADNFQRVVADLLKTAPKSAGVILHGDAAFLKGERKDYDTLGSLLHPISTAGLPVHLLLGNHDDRSHFFESFGLKVPMNEPFGDHHVAVLEGKRANLILLDTLEATNGTPGLLGETQLKWLAAALDARKDKPAIVSMHHNPEFAKVKKINGLKDTDALWQILSPRKQVKALLFGHTHHWAHIEKDGVHCVNLPPTAYVFQERDPNGWVELTLSNAGGRFKLHALDPMHKANGQVLDLKWRS
jgi:3',5'-cyclic-AMP phosphodiesterase